MPLAGPVATRRRWLAAIPYQHFLQHHWRVHPAVLTLFHHDTQGYFGVGIDATSALDAWASGLPGFGATANYSAQPNCQNFGVNTPYSYYRTRFGWTANQENDCNSNDTAIGFGINNTANGTANDRGAGYACTSSNCSKGNVDAAAVGLLWAK